MALSIKADEADALARELVAITNESITQAVVVSLRERLERVRRSGASSSIASRLERLTTSYAMLPVEDGRSPDEIIGYDDAGAPGSVLGR